MPRTTSADKLEPIERLQVPEILFQELDGLLGYQLRRAQGAMHRDFLSSLSALELTQKQAASLWLIHANGGASQVSIAAALGMDRATMMAVVDRLEDRGFVVRKRSSVDRRRQELYTTPAGQRTLNRAKLLIAEHEARFNALFKPAELTALLEALQKIQGMG